MVVKIYNTLLSAKNTSLPWLINWYQLRDIEKLEKINKGRTSSLIELLLKTSPKLLMEEAELLNTLNIRNRLRNATLNLTDKGTYSICSELRILRKEDVLNFYKKVNFGLSNKRKKFAKFLSSIKWI